jgi:hypothetical protein
MTVKYSELPPHPDTKKALGIVDTGRENAAEAARMGLPVLSAGHLPGLKNDTRPVAVIGMGSTLKGSGALLDVLNSRGDIIKIATGSTHRMINDGSLTGVDYVVIGFAGAGMADAIEPRKDITYIVAAQADPAIAAKIKAAGASLFIFNAYVPQHYGQDSLGIGSTAATAALAVFANMGCKDFEFFGVDSSVTYADGSLPVHHSQIRVKTIRGDFMADKGFYEQQTVELEAFQKAHAEIRMHFHGDSLNAALLNKTPAVSVQPVIHSLPSP